MRAPTIFFCNYFHHFPLYPTGQWQLTKHFRVEPFSYQEAIRTFQPNMVLASWMPLGEDWTDEIRKCESVEEYILIGEADGGCWRCMENLGGIEAMTLLVMLRKTRGEKEGPVFPYLREMGSSNVTCTTYPHCSCSVMIVSTLATTVKQFLLGGK